MTKYAFSWVRSSLGRQPADNTSTGFGREIASRYWVGQKGLLLNLSIWEFLVISVWSGFVLLTVRVFWRPSIKPDKAQLYSAVRMGGIFCAVSSSLVLPSTFDIPRLPYWPEVIFWVIVLFPVATWTMYIGLKWFQEIIDRL